MSSNRQAALHSMLQELKLTTMATTCAELALRAAKEGLSHEAFLYELARVECEGRTQRRIERRLAQSGLPREKTFATFHLERLSPALRLHLGDPATHAVHIRAVTLADAGYAWHEKVKPVPELHGSGDED